ncbi:MAG: winged helix-turn-helix domain-containing protein [Planctomycetota bacterium]
MTREMKSSKIAQAVKADILSARMRPGDKIKSLRELAEEFSVSIRSAQYAMDSLFSEGLIERQRGSGTFVKQLNQQAENTIYLLIPRK